MPWMMTKILEREKQAAFTSLKSRVRNTPSLVSQVAFFPTIS